MNTPSPLVPKGTSPEPRRKSHFAAVFIILFVHVGVLAGFLLQGCKPDEPAKPADEAGNAPLYGSDLASSNAPSPFTPTPDPTNALGAAGAIPPPPGVPSGASPAPFGSPTGLPPAPLPPGGTGLAPLPGAGAPGSTVSAGGFDSVIPPVVSTSSTPSTEHTVMKGETGSLIAKKYGMGWKAIEAANPGVDARKLRIGQKLLIPSKTVTSGGSASTSSEHATSPADSTSTSYTVKSGDTLARIAKNHGVSVKALKAANGLKLDAIKVGAKLRIPSKAPAAPAAPAVDHSAPAPVPTPLSLPPPTLSPGVLSPVPEPTVPGAPVRNP
jgi:LysM repeat protein